MKASGMARTRITALVALIACVYLKGVLGAPSAGDSCRTAEDHCGAPESGLGCCYSNTKCYGLDDCATYLSGCPFSNDTKKGESLRACLPDSSTFKPATCAASLANPAAVGVLIRGADVTCYESNKVTCNVFSNGTHKYVTASCKPAPAATSAAALNQMLSILIVMMAAIGALLQLGWLY